MSVSDQPDTGRPKPSKLSLNLTITLVILIVFVPLSLLLWYVSLPEIIDKSPETLDMAYGAARKAVFEEAKIQMQPGHIDVLEREKCKIQALPDRVYIVRGSLVGISIVLKNYKSTYSRHLHFKFTCKLKLDEDGVFKVQGVMLDQYAELPTP